MDDKNPLLQRSVVQPPRLHWTVVLVLSILTRLIFWQIWLAVQANWIKKVNGRRRAFICSMASLCAVLLVVFLFEFLPPILIGYLGMPRRYVGVQSTSQLLIGYLGTLLFSGTAGYLLVAGISIVPAFVVRHELKSDRIGLHPDKFMTLFLGPIYFEFILDERRSGDRHVTSPEPAA